MTSGDEQTLDSLKEYIQARTGLHLYAKDAAKFAQVISERMKTHSHSTPFAYLQYLMGDPEAEWNTLKIALTSSESSFFRDKGQIELLRDRILPELIASKQEEREIRLWSAGCSTGEEPYTLAMLLNQLIPRQQTWRISIIGSDINEQSLHRASEGVYSRWTLRGVDEAMLRSHFSQSKNNWLLSAKIRSMVQFKKLDLLEDHLPDREAGLHDMDLIVCRNLFIYYDSKQIATMVDKLRRCLGPDGYLLTGHAEIPVGQLKGLHARIFPESVIYQRSVGEKRVVVEARARQPVEPPRPTPIKKRRPRRVDAIHPPPVEKPTDELDKMIDQAKALFEQQAYRQAQEMAHSVLARNPDHLDALMIAAHSCANMGQHESAEQLCQRAATAHPLMAEPYYLMAQLSQTINDYAKTRQLLNKVIYLAPEFVPAYLELASIYDRDGSALMALKMRQGALQILRDMAPDATIAQYETISVEQLIDHVQGMLN